MRQTQTPTIPLISLWILAFAFLAAQFLFPKVFYGGAWCKPSLDAPTEQGFFAYQFKSYGFPLPIVAVVKEECFGEPTITYEWTPSGVIVDGLLPLIALTIWFRRAQIFRKQNEVGDQEK